MAYRCYQIEWETHVGGRYCMYHCKISAEVSVKTKLECPRMRWKGERFTRTHETVKE